MPQTKPKRGLGRLNEVELSGPYRRMLDTALASAGDGGEGGGWAARKASEAKRLLAMAELVGPKRMAVEMLDLHGDLRARVRLTTPVALRSDADGKLRIADRAVIGIVYPPHVLRSAVPGSALVGLISPAWGAWYPNEGGGRLCLGATIPPGIPVTELVLSSYLLLSGQAIMLDPADGAGIMNPAAAAWWQSNLDLLPLSSAAFLPPDRL